MHEHLWFAEPRLLTAEGKQGKQACGDLKSSQGEAVDVTLLWRGNMPQALAPCVTYQPAASMCNVLFPAVTHVHIAYVIHEHVHEAAANDPVPDVNGDS